MRSRESLSRCRQRRPGPRPPTPILAQRETIPLWVGVEYWGLQTRSPLVGVTTLGYPSEHADPLDSAFGGSASTAEVTTTADTTSTAELTSRQPPTIAEVTAAASRSPTLLIRQVLTKSMVCSWRFSWRQCVIDNVHLTMTRPSRLPLSQVS